MSVLKANLSNHINPKWLFQVSDKKQVLPLLKKNNISTQECEEIEISKKTLM